ncbi:hypothetical protein ACQKIE_08400 [Luteibacter sp. NPDC031894]|jgi:hypothetical protein|uniref:hypothetical protein n=1 Tax=Luteibacter sp. NPDC031894 TaxID=3390572 RepID=UPI003D03AA7A
MNRFLDRLADLYAPLGRRGLLMDGQYRFAPDTPRRPGGRKAKSRPAPNPFQRPSTRTFA